MRSLGLILPTLDDRELAHRRWEVRGWGTDRLQIREAGFALRVVLIGRVLPGKGSPRAVVGDSIEEVA